MTKDKLVKFNHKASYYRLKKCAISFAILLGASISVAVPISITLGNVKAKEDDTSITTSQDEITTSSEEILNYEY